MQNSERLAYRLFNVSDGPTKAQDIEEIWQIDQDPEVMRFLTKGKLTTREDLHNIYIPRIKSYTVPSKGYGMWRVSLGNNNECIGEIIVRPMYFFSEHPHEHDLELGWRFARAHWGKGYASEAAGHIMKCLSINPQIMHYTAIADTENHASIRIMKKLGMQFVEHTVHSDPLGDFEVDVYRIAVAKG